MKFLDRLDFLVDKVYRWAYYVGAQIWRHERRASRNVEIWFYRFKDKAAAKRKKRKEAMVRRFKAVLRDTIWPIIDVGSRLRQYKARLKKAKIGYGFRGVAVESFKIVWELIVLLWHIVAGVLNYVAPVVAIVLLVTVINTFKNYTFALSVDYAGEHIGYIQDESVFEAAEKEVKQRIVYDNAVQVTIERPAAASATSQTSEEQETNSSSAASETPQGAGLRQVNTLQGASTAASGSEQAQAMTIAPAALKANSDQMAVSVPKFSLAVVSPEELLDEDILTDLIIQSSGSEITQASGLYIEGEFKAASTDPDKVLDLMSRMLDQYQTGEENEKIQFVSKIALKDGLYPASSLRDVSTIDEMLSGNTSGESYYSVVEGDDPWSISEKTGVPLKELQNLNPDMSKNFMPGKQILVSRSVPMMKVQVTRRETYEQEQPYETEYIEDSKLLKGVEQVQTSGVNGVNQVVADVTYIDGVEILRNVVKTDPISEPKNRVIKRGTNIPKSNGNGTATGGFIWPAGGGYISCAIWGYWGHTGTDIAGSTGTPIYASMSGRVVYSGQTYYGYGKHIIIDHGNGIQTLYAHNSALYVSYGQQVQQGQTIAAMGRTGNATGTHVHFEIRQAGKYLDARNYIGYRSPY